MRRRKTQCSRRSPPYPNRIEPWLSDSTRLSKPTYQRSRQRPGTECPLMPKTATWCASSRVRRNLKRGTATLGFSDKAKLDEGSMWPTAYALKELTEVEETR